MQQQSVASASSATSVANPGVVIQQQMAGSPSVAQSPIVNRIQPPQQQQQPATQQMLQNSNQSQLQARHPSQLPPGKYYFYLNIINNMFLKLYL